MVTDEKQTHEASEDQDVEARVPQGQAERSQKDAEEIAEMYRWAVEVSANPTRR